jgi:hypothetical protein
MEQLYTTDELSQMLGVSYTTVYNMLIKCQTCKKRINKCECAQFNPNIKGVNISTGTQRVQWRIPKTELEKMLRRNVRINNKKEQV